MGDLSKSDRRSLLERYHAALSGSVAPERLWLARERFLKSCRRQQETVEMAAIRSLHLDRTYGQSSPAETDARVRQIIDGKDKA